MPVGLGIATLDHDQVSWLKFIAHDSLTILNADFSGGDKEMCDILL